MSEGTNSQDVEALVGEHLLAHATIAAHFVAVAEAAGLRPATINSHLHAIAALTGLEFWITDETGLAYLRSSLDIRFRFDPNPNVHPQASEFWPVLTGERSAFVQEVRKREIDDRVFKYAAVAGIDKPRIVQVGIAFEKTGSA